jgi:Putative auto-transporter adhesin, head GIN domain
MLMRFFLLIVFLLLLSCTAGTKAPQNLPYVSKKTVRHHKLPAFDKIQIEGNINVDLHTGYKHSKVSLRGDANDLNQIVSEVRGNVLVIKGYPHHGAVSADIRTTNLSSFTYKGRGKVRGTHLRSQLLDLSIDNSGQTILGGAIILRKFQASGGGQVQVDTIGTRCAQLIISGNTKACLNGVIHLSKLTIDGGARLSLPRVISHGLTVHGKGKACIQLAGIVDKLDVELWDSARFNGRYLRAKRAFVKTHDKAVADFAALNHQHTFATDASDIYFYKIPKTKADFMACDGSVLDMRDWDPYDFRDYDRYNK